MVALVTDVAHWAAKEATHGLAYVITRARVLSPPDKQFQPDRIFYCFIGGRGIGKSTLVKSLFGALHEKGHKSKHIALIGSDIVPAQLRRHVDRHLVHFLSNATSDNVSSGMGKLGAAILTRINQLCLAQGGPVIMNIHGNQVEPIRRAAEIAAGAGYETRLVLPVVPMDLVHERVRQRSKIEHRGYNEGEVTRSHAAVARNLPRLFPMFGETYLIDNSGRRPADLGFFARTPHVVPGEQHPIIAHIAKGRTTVYDARSYRDFMLEARSLSQQGLIEMQPTRVSFSATGIPPAGLNS